MQSEPDQKHIDMLEDDPELKEHLKAVSEWLDENVVEYPEPEKVKLFNFKRTPNNYDSWDERAFQVALDDTIIEDDIRFEANGAKNIRLYWPMFHSPLGAPCSYRAIEVTKDTVRAIEHALKIGLKEDYCQDDYSVEFELSKLKHHVFKT